jgi:hypothetical protein
VRLRQALHQSHSTGILSNRPTEAPHSHRPSSEDTLQVDTPE